MALTNYRSNTPSLLAYLRTLPNKRSLLCTSWIHGQCLEQVQANNYGLFCMFNIYSSVTSVSVFCFNFRNQCLALLCVQPSIKNLNVLRGFELKYFWVSRNWPVASRSTGELWLIAYIFELARFPVTQAVLKPSTPDLPVSTRVLDYRHVSPQPVSFCLCVHAHVCAGLHLLAQEEIRRQPWVSWVRASLFCQLHASCPMSRFLGLCLPPSYRTADCIHAHHCIQLFTWVLGIQTQAVKLAQAL